MRGDSPLVKHISKTWTPKAAWAWQTLPFLEMPLTSNDELQTIFEHVRTVDPETLHMPFDDFVLDFWSYNDDADETAPSMHVWTRISTAAEYIRRARQISPWNMALRKGHALYGHLSDLEGATFFLESWTYLPQDDLWWGTASEPVAYALFAKSFHDKMTPVPLTEITGRIFQHEEREPYKKALSDILAEGARAINSAFYLTICPEYLVEVQPEIPVGTPPRRQNDPKPWTYNYLPRIILLEPGQAPSGDRSPELGGTHASPRPHQRRGHWATLRHPRYDRNEDGTPRQVFVKPAWVGPREWVMQGNRYRVLIAGARA